MLLVCGNNSSISDYFKYSVCMIGAPVGTPTFCLNVLPLNSNSLLSLQILECLTFLGFFLESVISCLKRAYFPSSILNSLFFCILDLCTCW